MLWINIKYYSFFLSKLKGGCPVLLFPAQKVILKNKLVSAMFLYFVGKRLEQNKLTKVSTVWNNSLAWQWTVTVHFADNFHSSLELLIKLQSVRR